MLSLPIEVRPILWDDINNGDREEDGDKCDNSGDVGDDDTRTWYWFGSKEKKMTQQLMIVQGNTWIDRMQLDHSLPS